MALNLLIADDHPMFRAALLHALAEPLRGGTAREAASHSAMEAVLAEGHPIDLVLLDLTMPGAMGFSSLLWLRGEHPDIPVLVVTSNDHPRNVRRAQQFGAAGFVSKSASAEALREAVAQVMAGGTAFTAARAERSDEDARLAARLSRLTPAQFRVLMLMAEGLLNKQIAAELGLAENTVKIHVTAVLSKLECRSRTQAAVLVKSLDVDEGVDGSHPG
ncbi:MULTISPECIES: response regulator [Luteibacter]|uniref:Response regulator transcription factor n=1 Tax=Luteibacter flocculans TaxID=2780091 RepID=A0ABY4SWZ5_9GAMM|nr:MULTISPECIES: response regulator transcription factor [Luteibacter]URL57239.1 response regulator transcription factor [Luteibacter flocculans]SFW31885.1 DNA-binding response regulator, NarL/FixJ family, contains REC and HTH domains [Luteibacter sp. UNCMF366Tsu5.1]